jgi:ribosomal protein S18 acetylase RimI-like enzyme
VSVTVRRMATKDFPSITGMCEAIYPGSPSWTSAQLASHLEVFPEGQLVAEVEGRIVGMAASLVVLWDDYSMDTSWRDFTANGTFRNHDPDHGRTLYGAEVMVHPAFQGKGIGKLLYKGRREIVERRGLLRIRAGARLAGYHRYADRMSAEQYTRRVVSGQLSDPTLSFQLSQGFEVIGVAANYLRNDPESLGNAAVIEWLNPAVATPADFAARHAWAAGAD